MVRADVGGLYLWQFENLSGEREIKHFVTDRNSDSSAGGFTLSFSSHPDKELVRRNRKLIATAFGIPAVQLFFPSQVHKTRIAQVTSSLQPQELMETDALITDERGLCISVMSADCVPILLFDKKNMCIGAVHAGWRGTVARILEKTLVEMSDVFGTAGKDIVAGIGPSVCQDSYEVGEEVIEEVEKTFGRNNELLVHKPGKKAHLDLWKANKQQLLKFGVQEKNIEISDLCTVKENNYFFSARKGDKGRFAAGIMLYERAPNR